MTDLKTSKKNLGKTKVIDGKAYQAKVVCKTDKHGDTDTFVAWRRVTGWNGANIVSKDRREMNNAT
jgi:hypothetical protein